MSSIGKKPNYKVRTGARTASKGLEKELKRKAKRLAADPSLVLPRCTKDIPYFRSLERKLREVQKAKDSKGALDKYSKKGDKLVRAYAGTLLLLHEEKITYLAVYKTPFGDVGYAFRGSTSKEKLVGVQNFDDPRFKLMAYLDDVKKRKLSMFVTEDELICTGSDPTPPQEVLDALPKRLGKGMRRTGNTVHSPDLDPRMVEKRRPVNEPYLVIRWESAGMDMARSLTHSRQNEDNTFATCASYMASDRLSKFFNVDAVVKPVCNRGEDCPCNPPEPVEEKLPWYQRLGKVKEKTDKELYLEGKMMDHRLIEKERAAYEDRLKKAGKTVYIVSNKCYGSSKEGLLSALGVKGKELEVMKMFLDLAKGPVIAVDTSVNRMIAPFWNDIGEELLDRVVDDRRIASKVFKEFPVPRYQPLNVVDEARYLIEEKRIRKALPRPVDPPEMIEFAYECAIAYLARGPEGASRVLDRFQGDDIKLKAAKYAFAKQLDLSKGTGWSYTTHEVGYADGLERTVSKIAVEDPVSFKEGLMELWKATGSTQELRFK